MTDKKPESSPVVGKPLMPQYNPMAVPSTPSSAAPPAGGPDFNALKVVLETFKKAAVKKYPFTIALCLIPGQAAPLFEEDEALPKEVVDSKPMHVVMIIPEEQYKNIPKIKPEVVKLLKETKQNLWLHIKTPVDLWNYGLDSKFEFLDAIGQGFPMHDKGFLGALRMASIHKSLVLRKFDKYVASKNEHYNSQQLKFLRLLEKFFAFNKHLTPKDFTAHPLSDENPLDKFSPEQLKEIVKEVENIKIK